jgi:hypothetical protein
MNVFNSILTFLQDFWNLLEEFVEHMNPLYIEDKNVNDINVNNKNVNDTDTNKI